MAVPAWIPSTTKYFLMLKNLGQITFRDISPINKHVKTNKPGLAVIYLDRCGIQGVPKELGARQSVALNECPL